MIFCKKCKLNLDFYNFSFRKDTNKYRNVCKKCISIQKLEYRKINNLKIKAEKAIYYKNNKIKLSSKNKQYYIQNKDYLLSKSSIYYKKNKNSIKIYKKNYYSLNKAKITSIKSNWRKNNKEHILIYNSKYQKEKALNNIYLKLNKNISRSIRKKIKNLNSSLFSILPFTIDELKKHLESKFEPWMNWENWGVYSANNWNDNDSSTWKWQIDHIIPQSKLPYLSTDDLNFKLCWSLSNLRPLSAKINVLDGVFKTRH